jgi:hypothetical protein
MTNLTVVPMSLDAEQGADRTRHVGRSPGGSHGPFFLASDGLGDR